MNDGAGAVMPPVVGAEAAVLDATVQYARARGWRVVELDGGSWAGLKETEKILELQRILCITS